MADSDLSELEQRSDALGAALGDAASMAASFDEELRRVRAAFFCHPAGCPDPGTRHVQGAAARL